VTELVVERVDGQARGYVFARAEAGDRRPVFLHASELVDGPDAFAVLRPGDRVAGEVSDGPRGRRATGARVLAGAVSRVKAG
jgi:cold shock CspA family protein